MMGKRHITSLVAAGAVAMLLVGSTVGVAAASSMSPTYTYRQTTVDNSNSDNNRTYTVTYQGFMTTSVSGATKTYSGLMISVLIRNFPAGAYNTPWGSLGAMHPYIQFRPSGGSTSNYWLTTCGQQQQGADFAIWCSSSAKYSTTSSGTFTFNDNFDGTFLDVSNTFKLASPAIALPSA
jgi:hypothetical protein